MFLKKSVVKGKDKHSQVDLAFVLKTNLLDNSQQCLHLVLGNK